MTSAPNPRKHPPIAHGILDLPGRVSGTMARVITLRAHRILGEGEDVDDVMQDAFVRILTAQQSAGSRYDPNRGASVETYLAMVGCSGVDNALRDRAVRKRGLVLGLLRDAEGEEEAEEDSSAALARILATLEEPEEQEMAQHLAAGCSVAEAGRRMRLDEGRAGVLAVRVRMLLLRLREED